MGYDRLVVRRELAVPLAGRFLRLFILPRLCIDEREEEDKRGPHNVLITSKNSPCFFRILDRKSTPNSANSGVRTCRTLELLERENTEVSIPRMSLSFPRRVAEILAAEVACTAFSSVLNLIFEHLSFTFT